ncbi:MAG: sugar phosphate isomerase/epimerase [Alphaproteobacteria bacterium]|nr:sugar phosphate isomerase/epimerase [Alphaproteobacteria bacterium]
MRVGIFTGYYEYPHAECARRIAADGIGTIQLDFKFPDIATTTETIDTAACRRIRATFEEAGLGIAAISGYVNLVARDPDRKRANVERLNRILAHAALLGSPFVVTETRTKHPDDDWVPHPDTAKPGVYEEFRDAIGAAAETATRHGAMVLIEGAVGNVIDTPARLAQVFRDVPSPGLGLLMDPTNFLDAANLDRQGAVIDDLFGPDIEARIRGAHAKDVRRVNGGQRRERHNHVGTPDTHAEWPAAGLGEMEYERYLRLLARRHGDAVLILEHIEEKDVPRAKRFVEDQIARIAP